MFNIPVLFLVFNRPKETEIVFNRIKEVKPSQLFVAADGPRERNEQDIILCKKVRESIVNKINWPCEVRTLFRDQNLGCGKAVSSAISWFFENVEKGIILEDDILPDKSFFYYAEELLNYYQNDNRIMMISGFNAAGEWESGNKSYFFSYLGSIWGWATWRRAWNYYDYSLKVFNDTLLFKKFLDCFFEGEEKRIRFQLYKNIYEGKIDTWDYQWTVSRLLQNGLAIVPSKNLILNIGFDLSSTHTKFAPSWYINKNYPILKIEHNDSVFCDKGYDKYYLSVNSSKPRKKLDLLVRTFVKICRLLKDKLLW